MFLFFSPLLSFVLLRSWGTWRTRRSICFQIRLTLNCQAQLFMYELLYASTALTWLQVGLISPSFIYVWSLRSPAYTLSEFVSVSHSSSLLQCRTGSSGAPWGIWTSLLTEKFFFLFFFIPPLQENWVYRAATQLNWNNSLTFSFTLNGTADKGESN